MSRSTFDLSTAGDCTVARGRCGRAHSWFFCRSRARSLCDRDV